MIDAKILVIIPAYNEQASIARVIERVKESVPAADIVVINAGSHDSTSLVAYESGAKVISLPYNLVIGAAVQTGFILAQSGNYEIAIQVDGDGQHDPSEIEVLMSRLIADESDVVVGSRYLTDRGYVTPWPRLLGTKILAAYVSMPVSYTHLTLPTKRIV